MSGEALFAVEADPRPITRRLPVPTGRGLRLAPCTVRAANEVVRSWHRHSTPINQKVLLAARVVLDDETVGVAILGLPVSRLLDDGLAVEVRRVCVMPDAPRNACSMLYGSCCRAATALGYEVAYTYTLTSENATSVLASGFQRDGDTAAADWDRPSRRRDAEHHAVEARVRWRRALRSVVASSEQQSAGGGAA